MAVFLVLGGLLSSAWLFPKTQNTEVKGVYGGPAFVETAQADASLPATIPPTDATLEDTTPGTNSVLASDYRDGSIKDAGFVPGTAPTSSARGSFEKNTEQSSDSAGALPNWNGNFIMPTVGYDWGILHNYNAVDIANACGTPVVAAADGLVVPDKNIPDVLGAWNDGYGDFILMEHAFGNNVSTRYAHLEKILVHIGDFVKQGQTIGLMGDTGDSTGCHLHFEVIGAQNPFVKK